MLLVTWCGGLSSRFDDAFYRLHRLTIVCGVKCLESLIDHVLIGKGQVIDQFMLVVVIASSLVGCRCYYLLNLPLPGSLGSRGSLPSCSTNTRMPGGGGAMGTGTGGEETGH